MLPSDDDVREGVSGMEIESGELCPSCGEVPLFHEEADDGQVECPNCGEIVFVNGGESDDE